MEVVRTPRISDSVRQALHSILKNFIAMTCLIYRQECIDHTIDTDQIAALKLFNQGQTHSDTSLLESSDTLGQ